MSRDLVFLRPNVLAEPLVNRWNAYDQLIPPASYAMVVQQQIGLMESYVADSRYHLEASSVPSLRGGPWMNFDRLRADEVRALLGSTLDRLAHILELGRGLRELDQLLRTEAKGRSLEPLYARVPDALRGYVELVYDLNNQPSIRVIEGLLYRSELYDRSLQAFSLSLIERDQRPFQWTTPVLDDEHRLVVSLAFDDPAVDRLFGSKTRPCPRGELEELLRLSDADAVKLARLVSADRTLPRHERPEDGVRIRYMGHACVLVETREVSVLVDPFISYEYPASPARFTYEDLPERIDLLVATHSHNDHVELETLLQLRCRSGTLVVPRGGGGRIQDPSLRLLFESIGFRDVRELHELEAIALPGGRIVALPFLGEHCDLDIQAKRSFLIELEGRSILLAADARNVEPRLYRHLRALFGRIDVLFLGMECEGAPLSWGYGGLLTAPIDRETDRSRTFSGCDYDQAIAMVDALEPGQVYVYAMGEEPWVDHVMMLHSTPLNRRVIDPRRLTEECARRGIAAEKLFARKEVRLQPSSRARIHPTSNRNAHEPVH